MSDNIVERGDGGAASGSSESEEEQLQGEQAVELPLQGAEGEAEGGGGELVMGVPVGDDWHKRAQKARNKLSKVCVEKRPSTVAASLALAYQAPLASTGVLPRAPAKSRARLQPADVAKGTVLASHLVTQPEVVGAVREPVASGSGVASKQVEKRRAISDGAGEVQGVQAQLLKAITLVEWSCVYRQNFFTSASTELRTLCMRWLSYQCGTNHVLGLVAGRLTMLQHCMGLVWK